MLRMLHRALPAADARRLVALAAWLAAAATLHGVVLGTAGGVVAACLGADVDAWPWMIALMASLVVFVVVQWVAQMVAFRVGSSTARALHLRLGEHLALLPIGWFAPHRQGRVIDLATAGIPQVMSYPALLLRPALTALVTPAAAAAAVAMLDGRFALVILAASGAAWASSRVSNRLAGGVDARRHTASAEATRRIIEYADRQQVIRTDQRADDADSLHRALDDVHAASKRSSGTVIPGFILFELTLNAALAALVGLGVLWITGGSLTVPVLLGVLAVAARLAAVAAAGAELAAGLRLQAGVLDRLAGVLDAPILPVLPAEPPQSRREELVRTERVGFSYGAAPVLEDVSVSLPRRGLTAVVGPSGSGKTTLARLLVRFWDPASGRIRFDGVDLRAMTADGLAANVATVMQDEHLLDSTIGANIALANVDATPDEIVAVIRAAGLESFVADLPEGLDTPIGPDGARLSGGQRQRVCIARALLKSAPLTIMDEAASALDAATARLVIEAAFRLAETGSVVVIAHNVDTIARADQIIVLDRGRVVQNGTHDALAGEVGRYRQLLRDSSF